MYIEDAIKLMRATGQRMKRSAWKTHEWVMMVDPTIYPTVEGDLDEYLVVAEQHPGKMSTNILRLSGPYQIEAEAEEWLEKEREAIGGLWARYERYQSLLALKANNPLDYAEKPRFGIHQLEAAEVVPTAKASTKRLGKTYFAALRTDKQLEVYNFSCEDFHTPDWRTA